jgi:hypothetical protein
MRSVALVVANFVWFMSTIRDRVRWHGSKKEVKKVQKQKLQSIIEENQNTLFGKEHNFANIDSIEAYQQSVPVKRYQDFEGYIEQIAKGKDAILTSEKVKLFEPSSGTTSGKKLIPYNDKLQVEFQNGINIWLNQLYLKHPKLFRGKMYWSISPVAEQKRTVGGIPIGFMDDAEYLGSVQKLLKKTLMVMPEEIGKIEEVKKFQYQTALHLLAEENLTLISVWHPLFFILILDVIEEHWERLIMEIGCFNPKRAKVLERLFDKGIEYEKIWENLALISCWGDAQAESSFEQFKELFPHTPFESKGLIATEGFISFPHHTKEGANLSVLSHFFEFREPKSDEIFLAHELEKAKEYSVIMTTSGGLYRYEIGDMIEVVGFDETVPLIKFIGKKDCFVDMCGEKLSEIEVERAVKKVIQSFNLSPNFWMFAPKREEIASSYVLFIQLQERTQIIEKKEQILTEIEKLLRANFHYNYCRELGQLGELKMFVIDSSENPVQRYFELSQAEGKQLGDIKPKVLHAREDWDKIFLGGYV